MSERWPALPYDDWVATLDTLHAHTQLLGKLAVALAPPEPQLQHAALRLTARGCETRPLPAPDRSGAFVAGLDLHQHEAFAEHSDGRRRRVALAPDRAVADVTGDLLPAIYAMGGEFAIDLRPQETPWKTPLDEDREHATYDPARVETYIAAATRVALVLEEYRAPYRGRSTPVNAWWGSFDLAVSLFSGLAAKPTGEGFIARNSMDAQEVAVGWWPGSPSYPRAAFYAYAHPAPEGFAAGQISPAAARWEGSLGEFVLGWDGVIASDDPHAMALEFVRSAFQHACLVCGWDHALAASAEGIPPPVA